MAFEYPNDLYPKGDEFLERFTMEQERANQRLRCLVEAMEAPTHNVPPSVGSTMSMLASRIEYHKRMIATLEWFASHVGIDNPDVNADLVQRVIMLGLGALANENSREKTAVQQGLVADMLSKKPL